MGVGIALLSGLAQLLWWQKNDKAKVTNALAVPLILTLLFVSLVYMLGKINLIPKIDTFPYFVLLFVTVFAIFANLSMVFTLIRRKVNLSGGAVSHIGVALMLFGILFSSGYSNIISQNTSGLLYSRDFPDDINRDNVLLFRNDKVKMGPYDVSYRGRYFEVKDFPEYVNKQLLFQLNDVHQAIARADIKYQDKVYFKTGDTVDIYPENTYYQIEFKNRETDKAFTLYPRAQVNPEMGFIASPDVKMFSDKDLYTHVRVAASEEDKQWSELKEQDLAIGDTLYLNDYFAVLKNIEPTRDVKGVQLAANDVAVQADFIISGEDKDYHAHPVFVIKDNLVGRIPDEVDDLGLRLTFVNIDTKNNKFKIGVNTTQKDYVILAAVEKPFINILWIGTIVMSIGMGMAIVKRYKETKTVTKPDTGNSKKRVVRNKQLA
jgi:cytochrome c-type biogenesis protein CcmF